jgi:hypothetical protein
MPNSLKSGKMDDDIESSKTSEIARSGNYFGRANFSRLGKMVSTPFASRGPLATCGFLPKYSRIDTFSKVVIIDIIGKIGNSTRHGRKRRFLGLIGKKRFRYVVSELSDCPRKLVIRQEQEQGKSRKISVRRLLVEDKPRARLNRQLHTGKGWTYP